MSCKLNNHSNGDSCGKNTPGAKAFVFIIPADEIVTEPARSAGTNPGDGVRVTGGYTLSAESGKGYWRKYELLPGSTGVKSTSVGTLGSIGFENRVLGNLKGFSAPQKESWANLANVPVVTIAPDKSGEYHTVGSKEEPAYMEPGGEGGTGVASGDQRIIPISLLVTSSEPPLSYDADTNALNTTPNA